MQSRLEYQRAWRKVHHEEQLAYHRKYYKEKMALSTKRKKWARATKWQKEHPEYQKEYAKKNHVKLADKQARRRTLLMSRLHPDADLEAIAKVYCECDRISNESRVPHEVDHIIPISRGGWHHQDNLQIITENLNRRKKDLIEFTDKACLTWRDVPRYLWPQSLLIKL